MYYGQVAIGTTSFQPYLTATNSSRTPTQATSDALTYRIYGPSSQTPLLTGSFTASQVDSGNVTGLYQTPALSITVGNGFAAGNMYHMRIQYAISAVTYVDEYTFMVV